ILKVTALSCLWNNIDISSVICNSIDVELTLLIFGVYLASFCHPLTFPLCWNIHLGDPPFCCPGDVIRLDSAF
uniref:Uncharacterized protein n=1 Tax=Mola mola TaxID=94237 RepID=A0A3Q3XQ78_MOLML